MSKFCKLKDISSQIASGITPSRTNSKYWENGTIPWLKTEQLNEYEIYETSEHITQFALEETSIKIFPVNTLSIAMYGEGRTRGNVAILKTPMTTNQACCNIVVDEKKAHYKFVYYFLKTQYFQLRSLSSGVRKNLNSNDIKEFEVRLPKNLSEQQQIASVLSALDAKIELNNRINAELEAMAKTLYDYWFVQFDFPFPSTGSGTGSKPYKTSGGLMVWNEQLKREIPEGWEVGNLFEVCNVQYGFPFSTDFFNVNGSGVPVIRIRDILENSVTNFSTEKNIDSKYEIKKGDILIGMDGNFHINYWSREGCFLNQRVVRLTETLLPAIYLRYQIEPFIKSREKSVSRTTVGHLSDKDLKAIEIIIPPKYILDEIFSIYKNSLEKIILNQELNQHLASLRDWLLPMLMNGQVTVAEAEKAVYNLEETMGVAAEPVRKYS